MKRRLAECLVCPATGEPLSLQVKKELAGEILEGELVSTSGRRYPITGGVPRMLSPELLDAGQEVTGQAFSAKWKRTPDFGHEEKSRALYHNWYLERYHFGTKEALRDFLSDKSRILDAGTGVGRDTRLYADHAAAHAEVFGVDLSRAIDSAYRHLKDYSNAHLINADLTQLPFPAEFFDFIACDQVLHHTRNTEESFHRLVKHLAPGGELSIYVYRKKAPIREFADDYLREVAAKMTEEQIWELSEQLTELGRILSELKAQVTVPDVPALGIKAGTYDVQRFIYWNMFKCYWNGSLDYGDSVMTNFDWYAPHYAYRHTPEEVRQWYADAGLEIIIFDECEAGISARGRKK